MGAYTLYDLLQQIKTIALEHEQINFCEISDVWDISSKEQNYMACWIETPVNVSYLRAETKVYQFAINILQLQKDYNDLDSIVKNTSDCEDVGDDLIQALKDKLKSFKTMMDITDVNAITLRHFTTSDLVGIRYDITINTQSNFRCYQNNFETA